MNLVHAALAAVEPGPALRSHVSVTDTVLRVDNREYDLKAYHHIYVVGAGKASAPMAQAIEGILDDRITAGIVSVKYGYTAPTRRIEIHQAGHPIPDERAIQATEKMIDLLNQAGPDDLVICLISGGGSA